MHFCWVPGHVGIAGNEKADLEAFATATTHNHIAPTRLPARDFYSHFSASLRHRWLTSWQNIASNKLRTVSLFLLGVPLVDRI